MSKIQLFPARNNVGKDVLTPEWFSEGMAQKMIKTGLWAYTPTPNNKDDLNLMLNAAKSEIKADADANKAEAERLKAEREELEALRVQLLTGGKPKKTEV